MGARDACERKGGTGGVAECTFLDDVSVDLVKLAWQEQNGLVALCEGGSGKLWIVGDYGVLVVLAEIAVGLRDARSFRRRLHA